MFTKTISVLSALCICAGLFAKDYNLVSPDGKISVTVSTAEEITWTMSVDGRQIITPSPISYKLADGSIWGGKVKASKVKRSSADEVLDAVLYRNSKVTDRHNSLKLDFKGGWSLEFRAYNDGVAYRFASSRKEGVIIESEQMEVNFADDYRCFAPYVRGGSDSDITSQYFNSFENLYTECKLSGLNPGRLSFTPLLVDAGEGLKVCISEVNIDSFPGLFLLNPNSGTSLKGVQAQYPKTQAAGGYNNIQLMVSERENYIAKTEGAKAFPWRLFVVGSDLTVAESDLTWLLAEPSKVEDTSWIKPGKVAWDWWNDWNIKGVDFKAGINTQTYKYYIDFAAANGIEYVIMDDGWASGKGEDLMVLNPQIDLEGIVKYAGAKGVDIILWAGFLAFQKDMENICRHYAEMGVKGFKVDFLDRDDQYMTGFEYDCAEIAAKYHLVIDMHGTHKPAGITRTWPNVLNYEGVHGLETVKWTAKDKDQVHYDVTLPFTRQIAGPMDYTQGAMRNATYSNFTPVYNEPMSQGTRCHQLGLYMVLDSPLNMLCDTPSNYMDNQECCDFISAIPTVWDETRFIDGKAGEYVVAARRSGDDWYVGGITDWTPRDVELDLSFLGETEYEMLILKDGMNADRIACDYKVEKGAINGAGCLKIHLAPGGGFAVKFIRK